MRKADTYWKRRSLLRSSAALCLAPLVGCASQTASKPDVSARKEFIDSAMKDVQIEALKESQREQGRGAAAALSLATLVPFSDWDYYYVKGGPIFWRPNPGQEFQPVEVPEGFVTDLTSIPQAFWQVMRPEGRYAYAAVVHDYLYWSRLRTKSEADRILRHAMEDSNVSAFQRWLIFQGVDKFGEESWDKNQRLKTQGERRMLARYPTDLAISWTNWKKVPGNFK